MKIESASTYLLYLTIAVLACTNMAREKTIQELRYSLSSCRKEIFMMGCRNVNGVNFNYGENDAEAK